MGCAAECGRFRCWQGAVTSGQPMLFYRSCLMPAYFADQTSSNIS